MTRWLRHPLFGPVLVLAVLACGTLLIGFLLLGPALGGWATTVLTACFGWNAATRAYRLDAVLLVALQPPLFALVVALFYADEIRAFLRGAGARLLGGVVAAGFAGAALLLVTTGEVGGSAAAPPVPMREMRPAPAASLVDHRGRPFELAAARGRPVALTFFYASCHDACPALLATLKAAETRLGEAALFAAVTLDPERDDVAALAAQATRWELGERWHLLTGDPDVIETLRLAFGVRAERRPDGEIGHDARVVLLDGRGRVAFTYRALGVPPAELARVLDGLARERA